MNGENVFDHKLLFIRYKVQTSQLSELEDARRFVGIPLDTWDQMDGGHYWLSADDSRTYRCKADVVAYYRVSKQLEAVLADLDERERHKGK